MRSGSRVLDWDTPMPAATGRLHLSTKVGDSYHGIRLCANRPAGADKLKALDWNMQTVVVMVPGRGLQVVPMSGHWPQLGKNGYKRCRQRTGGVRRLTRAERRMTYQEWVDKHDRSLDALKAVRRRNGDRPLTWGEAVQYAVVHGVVLIPELKSRAFARVDVAEGMRWACEKFDHPFWAMALLNMWGASRKCAAVRAAGGQFALIFGRFRRLARGTNKVKGWSSKPTQIWGPRTAKWWIR